MTLHIVLISRFNSKSLDFILYFEGRPQRTGIEATETSAEPVSISEETTNPGIIGIILVNFKKYVLWIVVLVAGCCCVSYCVVMGTCCHFGHYHTRRRSLSRHYKTQRTAHDPESGYDDYQYVRGKMDHLEAGEDEDGDESVDSHSRIYDEPLDGHHGDGYHGRRDRVNTISIAAIHGVASKSHQAKYDRVRSESAMLQSEVANSIQIGTPKQAQYRKYRASHWSRDSRARLSIDLQEHELNDLSEGDEGDDEEEDGLWGDSRERSDSLSTSTDDDRVEEMYLRNRNNTIRHREVEEEEEERLMPTDNVQGDVVRSDEAEHDNVQDGNVQNEGMRGLGSGVGSGVVLETSTDTVRLTDDRASNAINESRGLDKLALSNDDNNNNNNTSVDLDTYPSLPPEQVEEKRIATR